MPDLDGPHWAFALAVYGAPGVAERCLALQDRHGVDINLLLVSAYAAACGGDVTPAAIAELDAAVAPWRAEVIEPLRAVRRRLKSGPLPAPSAETDALRRDLQALEIRAEQVAQAVLAEKIARLPPRNPPGPAVRDALIAVIAHAVRARQSDVARVMAEADTRDAIEVLLAAIEQARA